MAPNVPALLEAHYAVPMPGAVLNALNYRLDAAPIAFFLDHGEAKLLITDANSRRRSTPSAAHARRAAPLVDIDDPRARAREPRRGRLRGVPAEGDPASRGAGPHDEWESIALLYTSGTTGDPKGVVYHHRGAYLNALGNALAFGLDRALGLPLDAADVPLQRLDLHLGGDRGRRARTCACAASIPR